MNLTVSSLLKHKDPISQLALVEVSVSLTFLLLLLLFPLSFIRRRHSSLFLNLLSKGVYSAITLLIAYIYGLMLNLDVKLELVSVWAALLLVVYGKTATALGLSDQKGAMAYLAKRILYIAYIALMFVHIHYSFYIPLIFLLLFSDFSPGFVQKSSEYILEDIALESDEYLPSSERLISKCVAYLDYSGNHGRFDDDSDQDNPFLECNYVVDPKHIKMVSKHSDSPLPNPNNTMHFESPPITIKTIWSLEYMDILRTGREDAGRLKKTCLSFSLFWLLLHRFAGAPSYDFPQLIYSINLFHYGIIKNFDWFEVIEVELAFLYDYFYNTNHFAFYKSSFWVELGRRVIFFGAITWVLIVIFINYHPGEQAARIQYHKHDIDVLLTGIVILIITLLELVQFIMCLSSSWSKVRLLCMYLGRSTTWRESRLGLCFTRVARVFGLFRINKVYKPWQRKLGQYSLLESCCFMQVYPFKNLLPYLNKMSGVRILSPGRKQSDPVTLSKEIKEAMIQTLLAELSEDSSEDESPGESKIKKMVLTSTGPTTSGKDAKKVLALHIATSLCEISTKRESSPSSSVVESKDFHVATSLSKYCAYLVAYAPDILPGSASTTDYECTMAIEETYSKIKSFEPSRTYEELMGMGMEIEDPDEFVKRYKLGTILERGVLVAKLCENEIEDPPTRWKLLASIWAQMMLRLATDKSNEWAHAERLADGGEFITHLWALLFHARIRSTDDMDAMQEDDDD